MSIAAPPSPPTVHRRTKTQPLDALIEEARRRARRRRRRNGALALVAALGGLLGYLGLRSGQGHVRTQPPAAARKPPAPGAARRLALPAGAALTILHSPVPPIGRKAGVVDSISVIAPDGRLTRVWRCPGNRFCGHLISAAWAPDGRRLAFSLAANPSGAGGTAYPGMHVIDMRTGRDQFVLGGVPMAETVLFGCTEPDQLAWSPDGSKIAYVCEVTQPDGYETSKIRIMTLGEDHARLLPTGTASSAWPSWSPDGARIAFSTWNSPSEHRIKASKHRRQRVRSLIYSVALDGGYRRLLASDAAAPVWSPDGSAIAYLSGCGRVRIVTPDGRDATPVAGSSGCAGIGPPGWPAWAPDGRRIAIAGTHGIYLIKPDGTQLRRIELRLPDDPFGIGFVRSGVARLAWRPVRAPRA